MKIENERVTVGDVSPSELLGFMYVYCTLYCQSQI